MSRGSTPSCLAARRTGFAKPENTPARPLTILMSLDSGKAPEKSLTAVSAASSAWYRSTRLWYPHFFKIATTSSSGAFPAPAPKPLAVPSIIRAPASSADKVFAILSPRFSWAWKPTGTSNLSEVALLLMSHLLGCMLRLNP